MYSFDKTRVVNKKDLMKEDNVMGVPVITKMEVYPVAGKDCMELNLSGAHSPFFTRNIVVLHADNGGDRGR